MRATAALLEHGHGGDRHETCIPACTQQLEALCFGWARAVAVLQSRRAFSCVRSPTVTSSCPVPSLFCTRKERVIVVYALLLRSTTCCKGRTTTTELLGRGHGQQ